MKTISFKGKEYTVDFKQTPNFSLTKMKKRGIVYHATTSHSYKGGLSWLTMKGSGVSCLFIIGTEPGEIAMMGSVDQKFWHAGRISKPTKDFIAIAEKTPTGKFTNPNLYLDGIEFVGGVDTDNDGKVQSDEVNLTEWQFEAGRQVCEWHANECGYELAPKNQITHQDIASYKPDLDDVKDEMHFRLFSKEKRGVPESNQVCFKANDFMGMIKYVLGILKK